MDAQRADGRGRRISRTIRIVGRPDVRLEPIMAIPLDCRYADSAIAKLRSSSDASSRAHPETTPTCPQCEWGQFEIYDELARQQYRLENQRFLCRELQTDLIPRRSGLRPFRFASYGRLTAMVAGGASCGE